MDLNPAGRGWASRSQEDNSPPCWEELLLGDNPGHACLACYSQLPDIPDQQCSWFSQLQVYEAPSYFSSCSKSQL